MKYDLPKMAEAIKAAVAEAEKHASMDDGGTCNFDAPYIKAKGMTDKQRFTLSMMCPGVQFSLSNHTWFGRMLTVHVGRGQGARRTKMAEAACAVLQAAGLDAHMYYQMD